MWFNRKNCRQHQLQRLILVIVEVQSIVPVATQTDTFGYVPALQERHSSFGFQIFLLIHASRCVFLMQRNKQI